jgi:hypothetical protein
MRTLGAARLQWCSSHVINAGLSRTAARALVLVVAFATVLAGCSAVPNLDQGGMGCQNSGDGTSRDDMPTDPGQPFAGSDVVGQSPTDVGRTAKAKGLMVTYRLEYATGAGEGYSECWCTPPTEGRVSSVWWGNGQLIVMTQTDPKPGGRSQPLFGWGCQGMFG